MAFCTMESQVNADPFTLVAFESVDVFFEDPVAAVTIRITVSDAAWRGVGHRSLCLGEWGGHGSHCAPLRVHGRWPTAIGHEGRRFVPDR